MTSEERHEIRYRRRKAERDAKREAKLREALDFDRVFSFMHLYRSSGLCFRGVSWKGSVQAYKSRRGINVARREMELKNGILKLQKCPEFYIRERGHVRRINSIAIKDRVPQKCNSKYALKPVMHRGLIYDNYASQEGKGTALARNRVMCQLERHIRKHGMTGGMIVLDFKAFFDSIKHSLVKHCLDRNFEDRRIIWFNMKIVNQYRSEVGLVLGSENSQDFAICTPNSFDHFIREKLMVESSGRYMDDGLIIDPDFNKLKIAYEKIKEFAGSLGFTLNESKTRLIRFGQPFTFLQRKYIFSGKRIITRPTRMSVVRERRKLKKLYLKFLKGELSCETARSSLQAWMASIAGTRCHKIVQSIKKLFDRLFIEKWLTGEEQEICISKSYPMARSSTPAVA